MALVRFAVCWCQGFPACRRLSVFYCVVSYSLLTAYIMISVRSLEMDSMLHVVVVGSLFHDSGCVYVIVHCSY